MAEVRATEAEETNQFARSLSVFGPELTLEQVRAVASLGDQVGDLANGAARATRDGRAGSRAGDGVRRDLGLLGRHNDTAAVGRRTDSDSLVVDKARCLSCRKMCQAVHSLARPALTYLVAVQREHIVWFSREDSGQTLLLNEVRVGFA